MILEKVVCQLVVIRSCFEIMSVFAEPFSKGATSLAHINHLAFFASCCINQLFGFTIPAIVDLDCNPILWICDGFRCADVLAESTVSSAWLGGLWWGLPRCCVLHHMIFDRLWSPECNHGAAGEDFRCCSVVLQEMEVSLQYCRDYR